MSEMKNWKRKEYHKDCYLQRFSRFTSIPLEISKLLENFCISLIPKSPLTRNHTYENILKGGFPKRSLDGTEMSKHTLLSYTY